MGNDEISARLSGLLQKLGIAVESLDVTLIAGHTLFTVRTPDSGVLIGPRGETLHALNHVLKKSLEDEPDAPRFVVDVNGYHVKHIRVLEGQAKMLAERARTFRYDVDMSPMSAYDRLIVHASLTDEPDVATESSGEGKFRHVVIKYAPAGEPANADTGAQAPEALARESSE